MPNNVIFQYFNTHRDLLLRVKNTVNGNVISQYDYTNDALGRRSSMTKSGSMMANFANVETLNYGYNARSELTGAVSSADPAYNYAYAFDNIGNRATASAAGTQTNYATNALNQYSAVDDSVPAYDADGNVISLKTATGTWQITYNGAGRPVTWVKSTGEKIFMMYDSLGRRFEKRVLNAAGTRILRERYVYAGYNCVQILNGDDGNAVEKEFVWDPTEPTGTRPLTWYFLKRGLNLFYAHDGNKNVSDVFFLATQNGIAAHYEYAPFGGITYTSKNTPYTIDLIAANPFRFSSEFYDPELDLIYYNYRHYSPSLGRWLSRDPIEEQGGLNLYAFCKNNGISSFDYLGEFLGIDLDFNNSLQGGICFPIPQAPFISICATIGYTASIGECCNKNNKIVRLFQISGDVSIFASLGKLTKFSLSFTKGVLIKADKLQPCPTEDEIKITGFIGINLAAANIQCTYNRNFECSTTFQFNFQTNIYGGINISFNKFKLGN